MKRKRCQKGNPCGYACIERNDRCVMELGPEVSSGVRKAAGTVATRGGALDETATKFTEHVTKNSFALPNTSFSVKDLANSVIQAYQGLTGEAKENLKKAMDFVVKDGQSAIISLSKGAYLNNAWNSGGEEAHSSWVKSPGFRKVMQWSHDNKYNPIYFASGLNVKLEDLKLKEDQLLRKIDELTRSGRSPKSYEGELLSTRKKMRELKTDLKNPNYLVASRFLGREGLNGFTNPNSRQVVVMDNGFDSGKKVDIKSLSQSIEDTMSRRAKGSGLSQQDQMKTLHIHGLGTDQKFANERTLSTYLHELGHQVHYRSGIEDPPKDSVSLGRKLADGRGLSRYSNGGPREVFAEAFVAFVLNPSALRKYDEPIYNWVSRNFNEALRNAGSQTLVPDF